MEYIVRESIYPHAAHPNPKLKLSPLVQIVFSVVVVFVVVILVVRIVAQYAQPLSNPFQAYADVFPGQPMSAVEARTFSCDRDYDYYLYAVIECTLNPVAGIFSSIAIIVSDDIILQITFIMRDNTLRVGDLEQLLEMPTVHRLYRTAYFFLPTSLVRAETIGRGERFSLFLRVWNVTFMQWP